MSHPAELSLPYKLDRPASPDQGSCTGEASLANWSGKTPYKRIGLVLVRAEKPTASAGRRFETVGSPFYGSPAQSSEINYGMFRKRMWIRAHRQPMDTALRNSDRHYAGRREFKVDCIMLPWVLLQFVLVP